MITIPVEFKVVNDSNSEIFEERTFVFSDTPPAQIPFSFDFEAGTKIIMSPDFRITVNSYQAAEQKTAFNNYDSEKTYVIENPDPEKGSPYIKQCIEAGIPIGYISRFNCSLAAAVCEFTFANGSVVTTNTTKSTLLHQSYDNIPVTTLFNTPENGPEGNIPSMKFITASGQEVILYEPYNRDERWNIQYQRDNNLLYKFEVYEVPAFTSTQTKIFENATESLIQVFRGHMFVDLNRVEKLQFYKHDATESITIQSGDETLIAIQLTKVSDIILP